MMDYASSRTHERRAPIVTLTVRWPLRLHRLLVASAEARGVSFNAEVVRRVTDSFADSSSHIRETRS